MPRTPRRHPRRRYPLAARRAISPRVHRRHPQRRRALCGPDRARSPRGSTSWSGGSAIWNGGSARWSGGSRRPGSDGTAFSGRHLPHHPRTDSAPVATASGPDPPSPRPSADTSPRRLRPSTGERHAPGNPFALVPAGSDPHDGRKPGGSSVRGKDDPAARYRINEGICTHEIADRQGNGSDNAGGESGCRPLGIGPPPAPRTGPPGRASVRSGFDAKARAPG